MQNTPETFTTGDVARHFNQPVWRIRDVANRLLSTPPRRHGHYRVFTADDLPAIEQALRVAGYLEEVADAS